MISENEKQDRTNSTEIKEDENMKTNTNEYTTFPRTFDTYKCCKPLLVGTLTALFTLIGQGILAVISALWIGNGAVGFMQALDKNGPFFFSGPGALFAIGGVALILPAFALAVRIVHDRPFSSYSSSRGGWNWKIFFRSLILAFIVFGCMNVVYMVAGGAFDMGITNRFTVIGFLICTLLIPVQAVAEEYVFRGLLMQSIGSWTRLPVLAMVLSSIVFAIFHSYNLMGILAVLSSGLMFAFVTWYTRGLEVSSAAHIVNNMTLFYGMGLCLNASQEGGIGSLLFTVAMNIIYGTAVVLLDRKFGWFSEKSSPKGTSEAGNQKEMLILNNNTGAA